MVYPAGFKAGVLATPVIAFPLICWGIVAGIAMVKSGLPVWVALVLTFVMFSGTTQLATVPLMVAGFPAWVVLLTALAINVRFLIFSAAYNLHFGHLPFWRRMALGYFSLDMGFVLFQQHYPTPSRDPVNDTYKEWWLMGSGIFNWGCWQVASVVGIFLGSQIPTHWGLAFAGTLALGVVTLSMTHNPNHSALKRHATWFGALIAAVIGVVFYALPYKLNLVLAIGVGMAASMWLENKKDGKKNLHGTQA